MTEPSRWPIRRVMSLDPGDVHNGLARWRFERVNNDTPGEPSSPISPTQGGGGLGALNGWQPVLLGSVELTPDELIRVVEAEIGGLDVLVFEEFRLYPWMARQQGFSSFGTVERIGVIKYLAEQAGVPWVAQGASVKKMAVQIARGYEFPMKRLSGGRVDFPGRNQHCRDAEAHGAWFFYRNEMSPAVEKTTGSRRRGG